MPEEQKEDNTVASPEEQSTTPTNWDTQSLEPIPSESSSSPVIDEAAASLDMESTGPEELAATIEDPAVASSFTPFVEASEPTTGLTSGPETPTPDVKPKKSKKKFIIVGVIVLVLAVLGGGGAFAYNTYQSPQKVISDAIISAVTAKQATYTGTVTLNSNDVKASIALTAKQAEAAGSVSADITLTSGGKDYTLTGEAIMTSSGDLYVRLTKLDSISATITSLANAELGGADSSALVQKLVAKVDGAWIKISSDDLKSYSESAASAQSCSNTVIKKYENDSSATKEVTDLYQKHQFIIVDKDLGVVDGSVGYQLKTDKSAATAFADGLKSTKIYKDLHDCDNSFTVDSNTLTTDSSSTSTGYIQLWANQWSHQLTKLVLSSTSDGTTLNATIKPDFTQAVKIDAPSSTITMSQLTSDLTGILGSAN